MPRRSNSRHASPEYNSVDAALWFVIAADTYLAGDTTAADRQLLLRAICDGDAPHRAVGCPFQAWSLAEAIRIDQLLG